MERLWVRNGWNLFLWEDVFLHGLCMGFSRDGVHNSEAKGDRRNPACNYNSWSGNIFCEVASRPPACFLFHTTTAAVAHPPLSLFFPPGYHSSHLSSRFPPSPSPWSPRGSCRTFPLSLSPKMVSIQDLIRKSLPPCPCHIR